MTEEVEQLLKNLKLRRMLAVLTNRCGRRRRRSPAIAISWPGCCARNGTTVRTAPLECASGVRTCRTLVFGNVPVGAAAGREPQTD